MQAYYLAKIKKMLPYNEISGSIFNYLGAFIHYSKPLNGQVNHCLFEIIVGRHQ